MKELTRGNPLKLILLFMLPIFFGNVFQQFYNFTDALIVGRTLGISALGAVGACGPLIFLVISFIFASTQGFSVVTAQKFGAKDYANVKKSVGTSFILSFFLTLILTVISAPFAYKMLEVLNTPPDIIQSAGEYLYVMFLGIFATVFYNLSSNIIRALGDSKTPLYFLIFASVLNIILDLLFILKFGWGIKGTALATVVSQGVSSVLCLTYMFSKFKILHLSKKDWLLEKEFALEHLKIGIPMGFQMSILSLGVVALQFVLNTFGSDAVAAFTTAMRVDQIFSQTYLALGAAIATFSAQNFGANLLPRIKQGARAGILITFSTSVVFVILLWTFADKIVALFMDIPSENVIRLAVQYIHIISVFFFFFGVLLIYRNVLQGTGNVLAPLASGVAELVARAFGAFVLGHFFGYIGICFATPAAWVTGAIVLFICYKLSFKLNLSDINQTLNFQLNKK